MDDWPKRDANAPRLSVKNITSPETWFRLRVWVHDEFDDVQSAPCDAVCLKCEKTAAAHAKSGACPLPSPAQQGVWTLRPRIVARKNYIDTDEGLFRLFELAVGKEYNRPRVQVRFLWWVVEFNFAWKKIK